MRIDLHLHSPASRSNDDAIKWDSLHDSLTRLMRENVSIAAFSDHNTLDVDFYLEARELASTANILLLPAIEVNVARTDGNRANIIYVFRNDLTKEKLNKIFDITKTIHKKGINIKEVNAIFNDFETIIIPHVGKSDHFKYQDLLEIKYDAIEISNEEDKNYLKVISREDIRTSVVAFSDTHRWNEYPQLRRLITIIDMKEQSFDELKRKLNENKNYSIRRLND